MTDDTSPYEEMCKWKDSLANDYVSPSVCYTDEELAAMDKEWLERNLLNIQEALND